MREKVTGLYPKLLEIQKGCRALSKNAKGFGYEYVSGSKLLDYIRPKMDDLGLLLIPTTVAMTGEEVDTGKKREVLVTLHKAYTWRDVESGETLTTDFFAQGCNGFDKGLGSAETYAERYFLLKFFHIATDEDDVDALMPDDGKAVKGGKGASTATAAAPTLAQAIAALEAATDRSSLIAAYRKYKPYFDGNADFDSSVKAISAKYSKDPAA